MKNSFLRHVRAFLKVMPRRFFRFEKSFFENFFEIFFENFFEKFFEISPDFFRFCLTLIPRESVRINILRIL